MEMMLDRLADLEDRQVHRDHHAADQHAEQRPRSITQETSGMFSAALIA